MMENRKIQRFLQHFQAIGTYFFLVFWLEICIFYQGFRCLWYYHVGPLDNSMNGIAFGTVQKRKKERVRKKKKDFPYTLTHRDFFPTPLARKPRCLSGFWHPISHCTVLHWGSLSVKAKIKERKFRNLALL